MDLFDDLPPPTNDITSESNIAANNSNQTRASKRQGEVCPQIHSKSKRTREVQYKLRGFVAERKGEREDMQDAHVIIDDYLSRVQQTSENVQRMAYYAVFDGHVGPRASLFAARNLHVNIEDKMRKGDVLQNDREMKKCLVDAYSLTDEQFLSEASKMTPVVKDGSTALSVLAVDDVLYVANLGDSKAVLCRCSKGNISVVPLSKDHSPAEYTERMRIQKAGGTVKDGRVQGILEVSRSLGDGRFKHCGVISTPDIKRCTLTENDRFLLLACDGLWKGFTVDAAVKYINNIINDESIVVKQESTVKGLAAEYADLDPLSYRFQTACDHIASDAIRNGSSDNVTVLLVSITS